MLQVENAIMVTHAARCDHATHRFVQTLFLATQCLGDPLFRRALGVNPALVGSYLAFLELAHLSRRECAAYVTPLSAQND